MPPAREVLTVFVDGEERPGVTLYALLRPGADDLPEPLEELWPSADVRRFHLRGESWEVRGWDLALNGWQRGENWREVIRETLGLLIRGGAIVAWVGAEGLGVADPPDLFDPSFMSGSVLASMTSGGDFTCPTDPDHPVHPVDDEGLMQLRHHAQGLADASA